MTWTVGGDIAKRLKELRGAAGWRQADLAQATARTIAAISAWERGVSIPPRGVLERLANLYGWPVEIFAKGGPRPGAIITAPVKAPATGKQAGAADLGPLPNFSGASLAKAYQLAVEDLAGWTAKQAELRGAAARAIQLLNELREAAARDVAVSAKDQADAEVALRVKLKVAEQHVRDLLARQGNPRAG